MACEQPEYREPSPTFRVRVVGESGQPLENVLVQSLAVVHDPTGSEVQWLTHHTDRDGWVELDSYGSGNTGSLKLTNYFPSFPILLSDSTYTLTTTPYKSTTVATLEGDDYFFYKDGIISLTSNGAYRYYQLNETDISAPITKQLEIGGPISAIRLNGDILSISVSDYERSRCYFDLSNPSSPSLLLQTASPNHLTFLATRGDVAVAIVGESNQKTKLLQFSNDSLIELSTIPNFYKPHVFLNDQWLMMFYSDGLITYDISDPTQPTLASRGPGISLDSALFVDSTMIRRVSGNDAFETVYETFDMRDPARPVPNGRFTTPGRLWHLADLEHGFYTYNFDGNAMSTEAFYMVREPDEEEFKLVGYSTSAVAVVRGQFAIGGDTLYSWTAK